MNKPTYAIVAKKHLKNCGADQICPTSENAYLKNYVLTARYRSIDGTCVVNQIAR